jgi:hypothetical protein
MIRDMPTAIPLMRMDSFVLNLSTYILTSFDIGHLLLLDHQIVKTLPTWTLPFFSLFIIVVPGYTR